MARAKISMLIPITVPAGGQVKVIVSGPSNNNTFGNDMIAVVLNMSDKKEFNFGIEEVETQNG